MGENAGLLGRHGTAELGHDALGKIIGVDQFVAHQAHERHLQSEIAADDPGDHALVGKMAESLLGDGADPGDMDQRQPVGPGAAKETLLQRVKDGFRSTGAAIAADDQRVGIA